ncbi:MAG TPA: ABC transporter ATP-binding protein [Solirubrobacterales bacterium]|nr:ABC transporter ATP-binding protein [Solirubrobacterales bacterium]
MPETPDQLGSVRSGIRVMSRGHEPLIGGLVVTAVLSGLAEAGILAVIAQVAAALVSGTDAAHFAIGPLDLDPSISQLLGLAAIFSLARIALQAFSSLQQARLAADSQANARRRLFAAFTHASWGLQSRDREGHLQELLTTQAMQAAAGSIQLATLISALLTFLVLVASAMLLDFFAAVIVVIVALGLFAALRPLSSLGRRNARDLSRSQLDYANGAGEAVRMAEETHVFGVGETQREQMEALNAIAKEKFLKTQFVGRLIPSLFQSMIYLTVVGGLALLYATNAGQVSALGAVILMMVRAGSYGQQVQASYQGVLQALPFIERINAASEHYEEGRERPGSRPLGEIGAIAFDRVSFAYREGEPVLSEISFEAARGDTIGVIGPSGAGKSTLVQILLRLRQPTSGTYRIDGRPAPEISLADWHRRIAYVPQKPQLVHATVSENIDYFRGLDAEAVERAASLARIDEDVRGWANGYETMIGPRADSISGGQQQRICLARALAARPEVLILDEPTSALDPQSELLIQESLAEIAEELTLFVVTHRMSMLSVCDNVLVIVDGHLDDFGRTHELRETNAYLGAA